jgi:hypothetical protein
MRNINPAFVRFGSSATEAGEATHPRSSASPRKRTNTRDIALSPLSARSGCEQSHRGSPYSITSSARASSLVRGRYTRQFDDMHQSGGLVIISPPTSANSRTS